MRLVPRSHAQGDQLADVSKFGRPDWCSLDLKAISEAQTGDNEPEGGSSNTVSPVEAPHSEVKNGATPRREAHAVLQVARKLKF